MKSNKFTHVLLKDGRKVCGDAVVVCMGPWSEHAREWIPLPALSHERYHSITLRPQAECSTPHCLFASWRKNSFGVTDCEMYSRPDNEVYVLGLPDDYPLPPSAVEVSPMREKGEKLSRMASAISSALKDCSIETLQCCYLPLTEDSAPLMGHIPSLAGGYVSTGHCQWGILCGPGSGLVMAELIAEGSPKCLSLNPFDPLRFGRRALSMQSGQGNVAPTPSCGRQDDSRWVFSRKVNVCKTNPPLPTAFNRPSAVTPLAVPVPGAAGPVRDNACFFWDSDSVDEEMTRGSAAWHPTHGGTGSFGPDESAGECEVRIQLDEGEQHIGKVAARGGGACGSDLEAGQPWVHKLARRSKGERLKNTERNVKRRQCRPN
eukprot:GHVS01075736.1.p1 GENE.GHVS01075736.1~~GHVS01075736.1.p1  ORF type:complete len:375 (-),score=44.28 GHVS01075736.1:600-1724(-)